MVDGERSAKFCGKVGRRGFKRPLEPPERSASTDDGRWQLSIAVADSQDARVRVVRPTPYSFERRYRGPPDLWEEFIVEFATFLLIGELASRGRKPGGDRRVAGPIRAAVFADA